MDILPDRNLQDLDAKMLICTHNFSILLDVSGMTFIILMTCQFLLREVVGIQSSRESPSRQHSMQCKRSSLVCMQLFRRQTQSPRNFACVLAERPSVKWILA